MDTHKHARTHTQVNSTCLITSVFNQHITFNHYMFMMYWIGYSVQACKCLGVSYEYVEKRLYSEEPVLLSISRH